MPPEQMFKIDTDHLPVVLTRKALLVLDLQNDFVSTGSILSVEAPPGFVENAINLATHFRDSSNDVIWVKSVFDGSRAVNSPERHSESVITKADSPSNLPSAAPESTWTPRPSRKLLERYSKMVATAEDELEDFAGLQLDDEEQINEAFLTIESGKKAQVVLPGSSGAEFGRLVAENIDKTKDLILQKSYYSAFKDGSLVQNLRAKFVTGIYLCGALTNISVFATAMDAARYGYSITIVEDCVGYISLPKHNEALRQLTEFTGCDILTSEEVLQNLPPGIRANPQAIPRRLIHQSNSDHPLENLIASISLSEKIDSSSRPTPAWAERAPNIPPVATSTNSGVRLESEHRGHESTKARRGPPKSEGKKRENVKTKIKIRRRPSVPAPGDEAMAAGSAGPPAVDTGHKPPTHDTLKTASQVSKGIPAKNGTEAPTGQESAPFCEGDSTIIHDLLDDELLDGIYEKIRDEVRWHKMSHRGGDVPRLVAVQGSVAEDGSMPVYRHPVDESPALLPFSPLISQIRAVVEKRLGHAVNHVLIQFYRDGTDNISEHSDKTLDILPNTFIANVSLGAQRTMVFRTKKQPSSKNVPDIIDAWESRRVYKALLPHNSLCKVGLLTNQRWLHGIRPDKRMASEKSEAESAFGGGRISLTFRTIGTFLDKDTRMIWGYGATAKTKDQAKTVINGETLEAEEMIRAFGKENHATEFDWAETYGGGFDVLHISNAPKLSLSHDFITDVGVKIMLAEYGIAWTEASLSPSFGWSDSYSNMNTLQFVDNDLGRSTVEGEIAVMLYLYLVYGPKADKASKTDIDLARQLTRLQKARELAQLWRGLPDRMETLPGALMLWDGFACDGPFLAGSTLSPVDFVIAPLLIELKKAWQETNPHHPNLHKYILRMVELDSVKGVLGDLSYLHELAEQQDTTQES
jgi:nicotinamidase-related amidase/glutathione S-transferase